jgi:hypothetical protein
MIEDDSNGWHDYEVERLRNTRNVKTMKLFGYDTGYLHSFTGPALIDNATDTGVIAHSTQYHVYGLKCTKEEWEIKVKKNKIAMIRKGK